MARSETRIREATGLIHGALLDLIREIRERFGSARDWSPKSLVFSGFLTCSSHFFTLGASHGLRRARTVPAAGRGDRPPPRLERGGCVGGRAADAPRLRRAARDRRAALQPRARRPHAPADGRGA